MQFFPWLHIIGGSGGQFGIVGLLGDVMEQQKREQPRANVRSWFWLGLGSLLQVVLHIVYCTGS